MCIKHTLQLHIWKIIKSASEKTLNLNAVCRANLTIYSGYSISMFSILEHNCRVVCFFISIFSSIFVLLKDGEVRFNPTDLHAANYHIMGLDLRNLEEVENKLKQAEIDFSIPTIFLAECVLVYIETNYCANLLKWFSSHFASAVFVNYEQVDIPFAYSNSCVLF